MPKLPNPNSVKSARTYTIQEAADALEVGIGTIRQWIKADLRSMTTQRPYLILGADIRSFLMEKREKRRSPLGKDELYCLSCRMPTKPMGMLVDFIPHTATTGRLMGLCSACEKCSNRIVGRLALPAFSEIFEISYRDADET